jgi:hypothetical protein
MPLILIKEDGTGKADANVYASLADCDAYHEGHPYGLTWINAFVETKPMALVMASRVIDAEYQFRGVRAVAGQALQWPRRQCRVPDFEDELPDDAVPKALVDATCELARELIVVDRTASPPGEGLKYENIGTTQRGYDKSDTRPIIPKLVQAMLAKYGSLIRSKSGAVKLIRV